jgi:hypothetical protein
VGETVFTTEIRGRLDNWAVVARDLVADGRRPHHDRADPAEQVALRPDGRVAAVTTEGALYDGPRRLAGRADHVAFAASASCSSTRTPCA